MPKYRAKEYRLLNKEQRTTRIIYTPQVFFKGEWCCFADKSTDSGLIECKSKKSALKKAEKLYNKK